MKLHEIELYVKNPGASKQFYHELLGLRLNVDEPELKVFHTGWEGVDLDTSQHFPGRLSLSFLVADLDAHIEKLLAAGMEVEGPCDGHLGMRTANVVDPDGHRIELQSPTQASPEWLRRMV